MRSRVLHLFASFRADVSFAVIDALLVAAAYAIGLEVRFLDLSGGAPPRWLRDFAVVLPAIVAVHLVCNMLYGTYGHVWEYASIAEATRIALASMTAGAILMTALLIFRETFQAPGPVPIGAVMVGTLLSLVLTEAVRFRSRLFSFNRQSRQVATGTARHVLIAGDIRSTAGLARSTTLGDGTMDIVGFVTPNGGSPHRRLAGLPCLGVIADVPRLVVDLDIDEVLIVDGARSPVARQLVDSCLAVDVRLRVVPDLDSLLNGRASIGDVRELEPEDLLARPAVHTDLDLVGAGLAGRRVLVTGAGGSIGAEIVSQVLRFSPAAVLALDHDETHLFEGMHRWADDEVLVQPILCDIRDRTRVMRTFERYRPDVVFHAAAHKHVPILESAPEEAVKTNILGTSYLLEAVRRSGVEQFVLISTDKAAEPVSVMGASKRMAEMLVQNAATDESEAKYSVVRFGNVLGSRGSVVPTFIAQINSGGPVKVTDPDMTRFFMTIEEAVELVLQAAMLASYGQIHVLEMGEPVRILDLAHRLIRMAGLVPGRDIAVEFIGRRQGEKLEEILSTVPLRESEHPQIFVAEQGFLAMENLDGTIEELIRRAARGDSDGVRSLLIEAASTALAMDVV